ncbi:MAG: ribonuclease P protein component 1 [Candidatus Aenigmatarchaeota archaeon]
MPITSQNVVRHELIGLRVEVKKATNKYLTGIKGVVVDETYNMLTIESDGKEKKVQKKGTIFIFHLPNGKRVEVDGGLLVSRPEDRIKKKLPRW